MTIEQEIAAGLRDMQTGIKPRHRIPLSSMLERDLQPMLVLSEADVEANVLATRKIAEKFGHG